MSSKKEPKFGMFWFEWVIILVIFVFIAFVAYVGLSPAIPFPRVN